MLNLRAYTWKDWVGLLARLILGITLLVSGFLKALNFPGSVLAVRQFRLLPYGLTEIAGYALPVVEIALGLLLVAGLFTRIAGAIGALLMLAFIIGIISAWARGLALDCGCFGGGGNLGALTAEVKRGYVWHIIGDLGLLLCGAWLAWRPQSPFSAETALFGPAVSRDRVLDDAELDDAPSLSTDAAPTKQEAETHGNYRAGSAHRRRREAHRRGAHDR